MVIGSGNNNIALSADKILIPKQMISTGIAKPGKKKTDKIVPQIIDVTHAAMQNYFYKDMKIPFI
jgi:hypothetical protein